ncbi:MAG: phage recombination protein Bet [Patescibacteria group bacterium]|nr:phage recombination protein Bet [Patescibacteria group bacterium]
MTTDTKNAVAIAAPRLAYVPALAERFNVNEDMWRALVEAIWPAAKTAQAVVLALSYCKARGLDPMKRPVHIVPVFNQELNRMVETIWPGIGDLRITATRSAEYAGRDATQFGPDINCQIGKAEMRFPEWACVTVYRMVKGKRMAFVGPKVFWEETYAQARKDDTTPNAMWRKRPFGQLEKCAEAAALRAAFPEEMGDMASADEAEGMAFRTADDGVIEGDISAKVSAADFRATPNAAAETTAPATAGEGADETGSPVPLEAAAEPADAGSPPAPPPAPPKKEGWSWAKFWASDSLSLAKARNFGAGYSDALANCPDRKRLQRLAMHNSDKLDAISRENPTLYKELTDLAAKRMSELPVEA